MPLLPLSHTSEFHHYPFDAASGLARQSSVPASAPVNSSDGTLSLPSAIIGVVDKILLQETVLSDIPPWQEGGSATIAGIIVHQPTILKTWFQNLATFTATLSQANEGTPSRILLSDDVLLLHETLCLLEPVGAVISDERGCCSRFWRTASHLSLLGILSSPSLLLALVWL